MHAYIHRAAVAAAAALLVGCADAPTATPSSAGASSAPRALPRPALSSVSADGNFVSFYDPRTGNTFTLDKAEQRIQVTGTKNTFIFLTAEELPVVATEFHGIVATDAVIDGVEGITASALPPQDDCHTTRRNCEELSSGGGWSFDGLPLPEPIAPALASPRVLWTTGVAAEAPPLLPGGSELGLAFYGDKCSQIASAALPSSVEYRTQRGRFANTLAETGTKAVVKGTVGQLASTIWSTLQLSIADHAYARTAVSILAYSWNTYDCGSRIVRAEQPIYRYGAGFGPGSPMSAGTYTISCKDEVWRISFDGGETSVPITVQVCDILAI